MPRYLDIHKNLGKVTMKDLDEAHQKDLKVQDKYGVNFVRYWLDEKGETAFCLSIAPNREAPVNCHRASHGLLPDEVYEVTEGGAV